MSIKYSDNFKLSIIREYEKGQKSNALIAREFGVARSTVTKWIKKYGKECPKKNQYTTTIRDSSKNIHNLNKRIKELERENEFLKKAMTFFVHKID